MTVVVRPARAGDVPAIDALLRASFPSPDEAGLVQTLCRDGDMVLMLVAEDEAAAGLIGTTAFSRMNVEVGGKPVAAAALAPVAVAAERRGEGIADALVRAGLDRLESEGVVLCFVLGAPAFYHRFGFDPALAVGYDSPYVGEYLMAVALQGGLIPCGTRGRADRAPAFANLAA